MFTAAIIWPSFTYTTFFFPSFQFNCRKKTLLYHLMLKATNFFLALSFLHFFCLLVSIILSCYYFFFFFYSCTTTTTTTTTTITNNNVSEGKRTPETSYKLWSFELQSFGKRKERAVPKLVLLSALGIGSTHTHTKKVGL